MLHQVHEIIAGRPVIGFGVNEYLDRAIQFARINFDYFIDPSRAGERKLGKPIYGIGKLADEARDIVIFVFGRNPAPVISLLQQLGYQWLHNIFDSRVFGVNSQYADEYFLIRDLQDLRESNLIDVYSGVDAEFVLENITVAKRDPFEKIKCYFGNQSRAEISSVFLERGVKIYVGNKGNFRIGGGSSIKEFSKMSAAVGSSLVIQDGVLISENSIIDAANQIPIAIGRNSTFGSGLNLWGYAPISIGSDCMVSSNVYIESGAGHDLIIDHEKRYPKNLSIGDHVWIGMGSCLLSGSTIGANSLVGAQSLVNRSFGSDQLIAGNPARTIKDPIRWDRDYTAYKEIFGFKEQIK